MKTLSEHLICELSSATYKSASDEISSEKLYPNIMDNIGENFERDTDLKYKQQHVDVYKCIYDEDKKMRLTIELLNSNNYIYPFTMKMMDECGVNKNIDTYHLVKMGASVFGQNSYIIPFHFLYRTKRGVIFVVDGCVDANRGMIYNFIVNTIVSYQTNHNQKLTKEVKNALIDVFKRSMNIDNILSR